MCYQQNEPMWQRTWLEEISVAYMPGLDVCLPSQRNGKPSPMRKNLMPLVGIKATGMVHVRGTV